jgi:hypothetical protein
LVVYCGTASKPRFSPIFLNFACDFLKKTYQYAVFMRFFKGVSAKIEKNLSKTEFGSSPIVRIR